MSWTTPSDWDYKEAPGSAKMNQQVRDNLIYLKAMLPAGVMVGYGGAAAPDQWLLCDGSAVSRETYAALFTAIGTAYGVGNGTTTFNLPNYKGKMMVGKDSTQTEFDTIGETGGDKTSTALIAHTHTGPSHSHTGTTETASANHSHTGTTSGQSVTHTHGPGGSGIEFICSIGSGGDTSRATGSNAIKPATTGNASADHTHTFTTNETGSAHTHTFTSNPAGTGATGSAGSGASYSIMNPYQVANYIIKY